MIQGRDIVVLVYLSVHSGPWTVRSLASELEFPHAATQRSLKSLQDARLTFKLGKRSIASEVAIPRAGEFLIHAVKYVFPPVFVGESRGIATAWDAPPLREKLTARGEMRMPIVWPYALGDERGEGIQPVHESVPRIAVKFGGKTREILSLVDAIRYGPSRVSQMATAELERRFHIHTQADEHAHIA